MGPMLADDVPLGSHGRYGESSAHIKSCVTEVILCHALQQIQRLPEEQCRGRCNFTGTSTY